MVRLLNEGKFCKSILVKHQISGSLLVMKKVNIRKIEFLIPISRLTYKLEKLIKTEHPFLVKLLYKF